MSEGRTVFYSHNFASNIIKLFVLERSISIYFLQNSVYIIHRVSMMDLAEKVYKKSDFIVSRKIADEFILVPIRQNIGDLESIFRLNEVGTCIWESINGQRKISEIKDIIIDEFDVSPEQAEKDLIEFIQNLTKIDGIHLVE